MAIQARMYSENVAFPFIDDNGGGRAHGENPSQDLMDNRCGHLNDLREYLLNLQYQQPQFHQQQPHLKYQDLCSDNGLNKPISMHSRSVAAQIQKQNQEIDGLISLQHERLKIALQAHRKQQYLTILKNYESKSQLLLRQKDEEIKRATNRRIELEELLRRTDIERQKCQMVATETEAMVVNLNKTIEELNENWKQKDEVEDEGSCCNGNGNDDENMKQKMICKSCFSEDSCVVMLPCRHLCSCKSCDAFLHSCPVCNMVKKATIQLSLYDSNL